MSRAQPLPESLDGRPFSTSVAQQEGIAYKRLRARDLDAPFHGVRSPAGITTASSVEEPERRQAHLELCRAYLERAGADEFFSHVTAARLLGIPLPWRLERQNELHVSVFAPNNPPQTAGVRAHRISHPVSLRSVSGLPCAPPIETWVQLATLLTVDELIVAGDGLVRRKLPLATLQELALALDRATGRPGIRRLLKSAPHIRRGTDSPKETEMRLIIVRGGLPEPVVGYEVRDRNGFFVGTPDLAYVREQIALDYEGSIHYRDGRAFHEDIERREMFQDADWRHIRVTKEHLSMPHRLVDRVRFALANRS